jgi:hypothetical protein
MSKEIKPLTPKQVAVIIKKLTAKFKKAGKAEKRMIIAQDVIDAVHAGRFIPERGAFVDSALLDDQASMYKYPGYSDKGKRLKPKDESIQALLVANPESECRVCALGGLVVACTLLNNHTKLSDLSDDFFNLGETISEGRKIVNGLNKVFSRSQLILIELAYEHGLGYFNGGDAGSSTAAINFGGKYDSEEKRLVAIMKNIVKNKGTFKP